MPSDPLILRHDDYMKRKTIRSLTILPAAFLLQLYLVQLSFAVTEAPACGELVKNECTTCHFETRICQKVKKRKGKGSWKRTITSMVRHGADIGKEEQKRLLNCLSKPDSEVLELCGMKK